jgi:hypothetical protein
MRIIKALGGRGASELGRHQLAREPRQAKGKADKSREIETECRRREDLDAPIMVSTFYLPAPLVVLAPPGPHDRCDAYVPPFIGKPKLTEVADRAQQESQRFARIPVGALRWPPHFRQQLLDALVSQLPCSASTRRYPCAVSGAREAAY